MREALGQTPGIPELQPRVPPTSFSAAVSSMNREAWPGFPVLMNNTPGRHRGEGVASAQEGLGKHLALGWARVCPPQEAQCRADSCPEGGPDLRISSKRSPGGKGLRGRGPEFQASLGPCLFWPSLPSAQRCPPPNPYSHQMLRSL